MQAEYRRQLRKLSITENADIARGIIELFMPGYHAGLKLAAYVSYDVRAVLGTLHGFEYRSIKAFGTYAEALEFIAADGTELPPDATAWTIVEVRLIRKKEAGESG